MSALGSAAAGLVAMGRADGSPLDPTSPQAQEWVRRELAKPGYHPQPSLWERVLDWLDSLVGGGSGSGPAIPAWLTAVVVILLLGIVAVVVLTVVRREPTARRVSHAAVLTDPGLTAADYRRRAGAAGDQGRWDGVVLDAFRAIAQGAVERAVLDGLPGRTADETAADLGPVFPAEAAALRRAALAFDAVRYGHLAASESDARAVLALDARVHGARPATLPPDLTGSGLR